MSSRALLLALALAIPISSAVAQTSPPPAAGAKEAGAREVAGGVVGPPLGRGGQLVPAVDGDPAGVAEVRGQEIGADEGGMGHGRILPPTAPATPGTRQVAGPPEGNEALEGMR